MKFTQRPLVGEVTLAVAKEMVTAYDADGKKVTKCVWFSLEQMDQLVTLLKAEKLLGLGADGVRIYFAEYTKDTLNGMDPSYIGHNTVVFVSTKAAYDPDPAILDYHQDYYVGLENAPHVIPENRGELCQPECNGADVTN